ncbi:C2H2 type conidiation transcription factor BrlA [Talaromyces proteolyticus]|uniref:C2H2 type master regulator of conidiophore development brlA n=1 Tax=Talaromyces proteolyticus TaxID=1131652 RepID=A0AAD4KY08_9EURO|nr:C2H2 type conidiation transcription factor BrlA [Talaromyces proteolyticus]KAH8699157.1 C2H2 type conidiation transcription factor BrlA [Talaromyces proteolyticus]
MAYEAREIELDPALQDLSYPTPDSEDMRSEYNMADRLTIDVDCPPLGTSTCSSFSPMDSPTPTPTSLYSQGSLASPGWHDGSTYSHGLEATRTATPLRSSFRMADITAGDGMMHQYDNVEGHDRVPLFDYMPGYTDNVEQFWIPQDMPKAYEPAASFACQPNMAPQYPQMVRNCYRNNQPNYLPESVSNPCLSRPIFQQTDRLPHAMSMTNMSHWMPSADMMQPQTITPAQAFPQAPMTPPSSYSGFPGSGNTLRTHTPVTPVRSSSMGSGTETPMTRLSGGPSDNTDEEWFSPGMRESLRHRQTHRQLSKKTLKKSTSKQSLRLENLPSIIKQVQFRCKEPGCKGRFKRQEHLKRHMKSHSKEKPHVCWVPGCNRGFSRSDNLNAHYTKTHSKRGGRNRYVATLDETSPDYDPEFRGQLTPDGRPIYGSKLDDPIPMDNDADGELWDE